jgi:tRNA G46 methylase TrmB
LIDDKKKFFFGRSKSRALSKSKKFFYENHKKDFLVNFEGIKLVKNKDFILEIGFGLGENLLFQASNHPKDYFIGADPFINGVANVVQKAKELNLNNISILDTPVQKIIDNFVDNFFSKVFVLFPDPWMKNRQKKKKIAKLFIFRKNFKKNEN